MQKAESGTHSFGLLWFRLFFILLENPISVGILIVIAERRFLSSLLFFPAVFVQVSLYSIFHQDLIPLFDRVFGMDDQVCVPNKSVPLVSERIQKEKEKAGIWSTSFSTDSVLRVVWGFFHSCNHTICSLPEALFLVVFIVADFLLRCNIIRGVGAIVTAIVLFCYSVMLFNISCVFSDRCFLDGQAMHFRRLYVVLLILRSIRVLPHSRSTLLNLLTCLYQLAMGARTRR